MSVNPSLFSGCGNDIVGKSWSRSGDFTQVCEQGSEVDWIGSSMIRRETRYSMKGPEPRGFKCCNGVLHRVSTNGSWISNIAVAGRLSANFKFTTAASEVSTCSAIGQRWQEAAGSVVIHIHVSSLLSQSIKAPILDLPTVGDEFAS